MVESQQKKVKKLDLSVADLPTHIKNRNDYLKGFYEEFNKVNFATDEQVLHMKEHQFNENYKMREYFASISAADTKQAALEANP